LTTKTRKIFDGPQSPVRQRVCTAFQCTVEEKTWQSSSTPSGRASLYRRTLLRRERAHRLFEEPRTSVSGHRGRTGAALDPGATLAGSFDSKLSKMRALSYRLITALGPGALTNAFPRILEWFFILAK
jgi:hypothetical protein